MYIYIYVYIYITLNYLIAGLRAAPFCICASQSSSVSAVRSCWTSYALFRSMRRSFKRF